LEQDASSGLLSGSTNTPRYTFTTEDEMGLVLALKIDSKSFLPIFNKYYVEYISLSKTSDGDNMQRATVFPAYTWLQGNTERYFFSFTSTSNDEAIPLAIRELRKLDMTHWRKVYTPTQSIVKQNEERKLPKALSAKILELPDDEQVRHSCYLHIYRWDSQPPSFMPPETRITSITPLKPLSSLG
jgi:hypothetical protein